MFGAVKQSISRKLVLGVLMTTLSALLVACATMLVLDIRNYQTGWADDLRAQADILATVTQPALEFNDSKVAQENLLQLRARPLIVTAAIYRPDGSLFAWYSKTPEDARKLPKALPHEGRTIAGGEIAVAVRMLRNGETAGIAYVEAEYPLMAQVKRYLSILGAVLVGSLLIAMLMSSWLQAAIIKPVLALTEAVDQVIRRRDFSMRVPKTTEDEVGVLVDAFNGMLGEVGERAKALEASHVQMQHEMEERIAAEEAVRELNNSLEARIRERTAELEKTHAQLRQSQKLEAIGQLTGGVAHDFNNVLQVIAGNLQLLQMSLAGNPEAQRRLESAAFAADRGAKLSSQLLAFARRHPLQPVATNIGRVLRGMDDLLRRALGESVQIETVVAGGLWTTMADPHQLENVILNLAINARDAMKGDGRLTLELNNAMLDDNYVLHEPEVAAGQYVMLAISDTGCGMPPDVVARAFEPFFTTKREGEGTGLGLSMAYGFVKQSGGHIRIYSEVGSGTTIKIYLPRSMQPEVELPNLRNAPVLGGSETILVVEDDLAVQATVVDMLQGLGYRVLKASDGQGALTILQSGIPVDMLFTDVVMPGPVRSIEVARQAKQMFPSIEVLFTSGYTQNAIVHGGRLDPGVELISKPYRRDELARKIRQLLTARKEASAIVPASVPASAPAPTPVQAAENGEAALPVAEVPLSILVVEDNQDARSMLSELLLILGHGVEGVGSAEQALELLAQKEFDVLLTDHSLPGMSGLELARIVAARDSTMKIIFSSGYGAPESTGLEVKPLFLPKPFTLAALQSLLEEASSV
ncbi:Blue-light-activated protein [Massilia sp. Bi118]|uniref:response regulator n=1 Tax=Massilia sp. Bi118 TaxID=2822346 RepID=UPI001DA76FA4|nr:response regulator [Massilia sp. Bi118]CAH0233868.1 Blue-light-activated protein [Massilia sp. Bi118]